MITQFLSILEFSPHEVPFVAPMAALLIPAFIALLWFVKEFEEASREKTEKIKQDKSK